MTTIGKWKDIAEVVALFAVVASLIAVVFELRQTQSALQAQAYQARAFQAYENHFSMAQLPEMSALLQRALADDFDVAMLSDAERNQLRRLLYAVRTDTDNEFYQYQQGFLEPEFYERQTVSDIKVFAPLWRSLGIDEPTERFRREVDRVLADSSVEILN